MTTSHPFRTPEEPGFDLERSDPQLRPHGVGLPTEPTENLASWRRRPLYGIPRNINVLGEDALKGGFAALVRPIHVEIVDEVCCDFDLATGRIEALVRPSGTRKDGGVGPVPSKALAFPDEKRTINERPMFSSLAPGPKPGFSLFL